VCIAKNTKELKKNRLVKRWSNEFMNGLGKY